MTSRLCAVWAAGLAVACLLLSSHAQAASPQTSQAFATAGSTAPLELSGKSNLVLRGLRIQSAPDNCIILRNCTNIRIEECAFGPGKGEGVHIISCTSISVTRCSFERVRTGVYALDSQGIDISRNRFLNVQGPMPRGQFVQFDKVRGAGNRINDNIGVNQPGQSHPEDAISLYQSHGTPLDPIQVQRNRIWGGGPSPSGGGIMAGDGGGS